MTEIRRSRDISASSLRSRNRSRRYTRSGSDPRSARHYEPGEYNQVNDEPSLNYIPNTEVDYEIALVRYNKPSGTDTVRATLEEIKTIVPGKGPHVDPPVIGRPRTLSVLLEGGSS